MEIPAKVAVFNGVLEVKGKVGTLITIADVGYYEINIEVNGKLHTVLFPIADTVVVFNDAIPQIAPDFEVER
ncbi:MAG: hypothetical protein ACYC7A_15360 [Thermoanaerobaculia bacterium]